MKKLIPVLAMSLMSACNAPNFSANGNDPMVTVSPTPVAPVVAQQLSDSVANGARTVGRGLVDSLAVAKFLSVLDGKLFNGTANYNLDLLTDDEVNEVKNNAKEILTTLFQNQVPLADTNNWVQTSPSADFCAKIHAQNEDLQGCLEVIQHVIFRISLSNSHSGQVIAFYDQEKLATVDFLEDGMSVELNLLTASHVLTSLKNIWAPLGFDLDIPTFTQVEGKAQAMLTRAGNLFHLTLATTEEVVISGSNHDENFHIIAAANSAANLEYSSSAHYASLGFQIGRVDVAIGSNEVIVSNHITGKIIFDDQLGEVRTENLNLDNLSVINGENFTRVYLSPLSSTLNFLSDGVTLTNTNYLSVYVTIPEGTTSWGAYEGGKFTFKGNQPTKREGTAVGTFSSGNFGNGDFTIPAGSCFRTTPLQVVDCSP